MYPALHETSYDRVLSVRLSMLSLAVFIGLTHMVSGTTERSLTLWYPQWFLRRYSISKFRASGRIP